MTVIYDPVFIAQLCANERAFALPLSAIVRKQHCAGLSARHNPLRWAAKWATDPQNRSSEAPKKKRLSEVSK
jgi:hypothetical protein